ILGQWFAVGMGETDPEAALAVVAAYVIQPGLVDLTELPRQIQAESAALAFGGIERLEDLFHVCGADAGAFVDDLQRPQAGLAAPYDSQLSPGDAAGLGAVAQGIIEQI